MVLPHYGVLMLDRQAWYPVKNVAKKNSIYILALFPGVGCWNFIVKGSCLVLLSPIMARGILLLGRTGSPLFPLLKVVVLRYFPPLDLWQPGVGHIDVQWGLRHPDSEDSPAHILRGTIFDVNLSGQSTSTFRPINIDRGAGGCHLKIDILSEQQSNDITHQRKFHFNGSNKGQFQL